MLSSKLIGLFYKLSGYERAALRRWVQSPYHNRRDDVIALFNYLQQADPMESNHLHREKIFAAVYPNEIFDEPRLRYVMSFLVQVIEDFLVVENCLSNKVVYNQLLTEQYFKLQLPNAHKHSIERAQQHLRKQPLRHSEYSFYSYKLAWNGFQATEESGRDKERSMQVLSDDLDSYFIAEKLKQICSMLAHQAVYHIDYKLGLFDAVIQHIEQTPALLQQSAIAVYYLYYKAVTQPKNYEPFNIFKEKLLATTHEFPANEMRSLYILAINYGIRHINTNMDFVRETLNLYQAALEYGLLLVNGKISRFAFKNIVAIALHLQEYEWTKQFIENYKEYLPSEFRDTYINFSLSKLYFEQQDYNEAMQHLQRVEYEDIFLNLSAKIMLVKIYYELGEYDVLDSFLASFRVFLNRKKKKLSYHYENYKNIILAVYKLVHVNPFSKSDIAKLREKITSLPVLTERDWLLRQLDMLGSRK